MRSILRLLVAIALTTAAWLLAGFGHVAGSTQDPAGRAVTLRMIGVTQRKLLNGSSPA